MTRKPAVLITGANGEIGHGLITAPGRRSRPADRHARPDAARSVADAAGRRASSPDRSSTRACSSASSPSSRSIASSTWRRCSRRAREFTPMTGAPGQRRRHAAAARVRAAAGRVARPAGRVRLPVVDRRLRPARSSRRGPAPARSREDDCNQPTTMYGCNKLYCEQLGTLLRALLQAARGRARRRPRRLPLPALPGPDLGGDDAVRRHVRLRAGDDPRGGARASRTPASSGPDTRIPFMAMPDGDRGAADARGGAARAADAHGLQRPRLQPVGRGDARRSCSRAFPGADIALSRSTRSGRASSIPGRPTSTTRAARRDWGFAPRFDFETAFTGYLIPTIRDRYRRA